MKKIRKAIARKFKNWKGATTAKGDDIEESRAMPADVEEVKVEIKKQTSTVDKATETDTQLCNENSEIEQPIFENSEEAQIETTVEPTSEPCFDSRSGNTVDEKSSKKAIQPIVAGVVGAALLVSSIVAYISKMYATSVIVGIVGLACISFALYHALKPNTKFEKVEEQSITAHPPLKTI